MRTGGKRRGGRGGIAVAPPPRPVQLPAVNVLGLNPDFASMTVRPAGLGVDGLTIRLGSFDAGIPFLIYNTDGTLGFAVLNTGLLKIANGANVYDGISDANPLVQIGSAAAINFGAGGATAVDVQISRSAADVLLLGAPGGGDALEMVEQTAPSTPAANRTRDYTADKAGVSNRYWINDAGTVFDLSLIPSYALVWKSYNKLLAQSMDPTALNANNLIVAATIYLFKCMVPYSITATNIKFTVGVAGTALGTSNSQVGLYSSAGVLLSQSADMGTTLESTGEKTIALAAAQALTGSATAFVWVGLHAGAFVGAPAIMGTAASSAMVNFGLTAATARCGTYTGHVTNTLTQIGNLTPASITLAAGPAMTGIV